MQKTQMILNLNVLGSYSELKLFRFYLSQYLSMQVIALSATELGGLIGLTTSESAEFFHDPHMGTRFVMFIMCVFILHTT